MKKRIIKNIEDLQKTLNYFNGFHDGFLKSLRIISGNKFIQNPPWESPKKYESNEKKLLDTGLMFFNKKGIFLEIHHYNYDYSKKAPTNKIFLYLSNVVNIDLNIIDMVGLCIADCKIDLQNPNTLNLIFNFETIVNNEPGIFEIKFMNFEKIYIQEKS